MTDMLHIKGMAVSSKRCLAAFKASATVLHTHSHPLFPRSIKADEWKPRLHFQAVSSRHNSTATQTLDNKYDDRPPDQQREPLPRNRFMLVDAHALMFRFHHAYGKLLQSEAGEETSITYGFMKTLLDLLECYPAPSHLVIVMDAPGKTFRHELFKEYKGHRPPFPPEISLAIPQLTKLLGSLRLTLIRQSGVEADDVIGTLALRGIEEGFQVVIVSPDKDFCQLLRTDLSLLRTPKKDTPRYKLYGGQRMYTAVDFEDEYGIRPNQWRDALALMGDAADNIPGVSGIGEKGALELLRQYDTLENMLDNASEIKKKRQREALNTEQGAAVAKFSQALVTIDTSLAVPSVTGLLSDYELLPLTDAEKQGALEAMANIGFKEHTRRWQKVWALQEQELQHPHL